MGEEPKDPIDAYDARQGRPEATSPIPSMSPADLFGEKLNPVRDEALPAANLKSFGS